MRRKSTKEYKLEAVRLSRQPAMTVVKAARDLGIRAKDLYRWRGELAEAPAEAFPGKGSSTGIRPSPGIHSGVVWRSGIDSPRPAVHHRRNSRMNSGARVAAKGLIPMYLPAGFGR